MNLRSPFSQIMLITFAALVTFSFVILMDKSINPIIFAVGFIMVVMVTPFAAALAHRYAEDTNRGSEVKKAFDAPKPRSSRPRSSSRSTYSTDKDTQ